MYVPSAAIFTSGGFYSKWVSLTRTLPTHQPCQSGTRGASRWSCLKQQCPELIKEFRQTRASCGGGGAQRHCCRTCRDESSGLWSTPEAARVVMRSVVTHHSHHLEALPSPRGGPGTLADAVAGAASLLVHRNEGRSVRLPFSWES